MTTGSGKTISSGPDDHIFVYFADHGAPGILGFGEQFLTAKSLQQVGYIWTERCALVNILNSNYIYLSIQAIDGMHMNRQYGKMVFYIEACESGSMFPFLTADMSVFATTASDAKTSSYACYWDEKLKVFLGDVYSINWLQGLTSRKVLNMADSVTFLTIHKTTITFLHRLG